MGLLDNLAAIQILLEGKICFLLGHIVCQMTIFQLKKIIVTTNYEKIKYSRNCLKINYFKLFMVWNDLPFTSKKYYKISKIS